jgi:hypothetical protein
LKHLEEKGFIFQNLSQVEKVFHFVQFLISFSSRDGLSYNKRPRDEISESTIDVSPLSMLSEIQPENIVKKTKKKRVAKEEEKKEVSQKRIFRDFTHILYAVT